MSMGSVSRDPRRVDPISRPSKITMKKYPADTVIGYFGFPRRKVLREARERFGPDLPLVDLDVDMGAPRFGYPSRDHVPDRRQYRR